MKKFSTIVCRVPRQKQDSPGPKPRVRAADIVYQAATKKEARRAISSVFPHKDGFRLGRTSALSD
jgi:hypothetical protein